MAPMIEAVPSAGTYGDSTANGRAVFGDCHRLTVFAHLPDHAEAFGLEFGGGDRFHRQPFFRWYVYFFCTLFWQ